MYKNAKLYLNSILFILLIVFILYMVVVIAVNVTHTSSSDFTGTFNLTMTDGENITLKNESFGSYTGTSYFIGGCDISPLGFYWDGTNWFVVGQTNDHVCKLDSSFNNIANYSVSEDGNPRDIHWNGSNWFMVGLANDKVYEYDSSWTYTTNSWSVGVTQPTSLYWNDSNWFVLDYDSDKVLVFNSDFSVNSVNYSVNSQDSSPTGIHLIGNYWYMVGTQYDKVYEYDSSWTYTGNSWSVSEETFPTGIDHDGTNWFMMGSDTDYVYKYYSVFSSDGTYTSQVIDASSSVQWDYLNWSQTLPPFSNDSDSFDTAGAGAAGPTGIALDTSDDSFWIPDVSDDFIYHFDSSGANTTGGFNINTVGGSTNSQGITYDSTDDSLWVVDNDLDFMFHFGTDGTNKTDGFSLTTAAPAPTPTGVVLDTTDDSFWVVDFSTLFVYHFDSSGANQSDGFTVTGASGTGLSGITFDTSDNTLWIQDKTADYIWHHDRNGNDLGDGINIASSFGSANSDGLSFDSEKNSLWHLESGTVDDVWHFSRGEIKFQATSCSASNCADGTFVGPANTTDTYFTSNISLNTTLTPNNQYFQYKAFFETSNTSYTPYLMSIDIGYTSLNANPDDVTPLINSTVGTNLTSENLWCRFTPTDSDAGETLTANVSWLKDNVSQFTFASLSVTQDAEYSTSLNSGNTSYAELWNCEIEICDDDNACSNWVNSTQLTINNVPLPVQSTPADNEHISDQTPEFNGTYNDDDGDTGDCDVIINSTTSDAMLPRGRQTSIADGGAISITSNTTLDDLTNYKWAFMCEDSNSQVNYTENRTIFIDVTTPLITWTTPTGPTINGSNFSADFSANVNVLDTNLYQVNVSVWNKVTNEFIYNNMTDDLNASGITSFDFVETINVSAGTNSSGYYIMEVYASDTHTKKVWDIPAEIEYITNGISFWLDNEDSINMTLVGLDPFNANINTFIATKDIDRYNFTLGFNKDMVSFDIRVDADKIDILQNSGYKGHIIVNDKYWYDSEPYDSTLIDSGSNYVVYRISGNNLRDFYFNSLGGLNTVLEQVEFLYDPDGPNMTSPTTNETVVGNNTWVRFTVDVDDVFQGISSVYLKLKVVATNTWEWFKMSLLSGITYFLDKEVSDKWNQTEYFANDTLGSTNITAGEYPTIDITAPIVVSTTLIGWENDTSLFDFYNETSAYDIEKFNITAEFNDEDRALIEKITLFWRTTNGTNNLPDRCTTGDGASTGTTGNINDETCHQYLSVIENTDTGTMYTGATVGDGVSFTNITVNDTSRKVEFMIDEIYKNTIKDYPFYGNTSYFDNGTNYRIKGNNYRKWKLSKSGELPSDASFYQFDLRMQIVGTPNSPLEIYLCNVTYDTGEPETNTNCAILNTLTSTDVKSNDATKYRTTFGNDTINDLGGNITLGSVVLKSEDNAVSRYYAVTYFDKRAGDTYNHSYYSTDAGSTWIQIEDKSDAIGLHWFYSDTTCFEYFFQTEDNRSNVDNSTVNSQCWSQFTVDDNPSEPILTAPLEFYNWSGTQNITWIKSEDPEGDDFFYEITLQNEDGTFNSIIADNSTGITKSTTSYSWDTTGVNDGTYNMTIKAVQNETTIGLNSTEFIMTQGFNLDNIPEFYKIDSFSKNEDFTEFTIDLSDNISDLGDADSALNIEYALTDSSLLTLAIDNSTNIVTFTSVANQSGATDINFTVWDTDNKQNSTNFTFTVNAVNDIPFGYSVAYPVNASVETDGVVTLSIYNGTDVENNAISYYFEVWNDSAMTQIGYVNSSIDETITTTNDTTSNLTSGTYYFRFLGNDSENGTFTGLTTFYVNKGYDFELPITLTIPINGSTVTTSSVTPTYNVSGTFDIQNCSLTWNGVEGYENDTSISSGSNTFSEITASDGDYEWNVTCYDLVNNQNTSLSFEFTVSIAAEEAAPGGGGGAPSYTHLQVCNATYNFIQEFSVNYTEDELQSFRNNLSFSVPINILEDYINNWNDYCADDLGFELKIPTPFISILDLEIPGIPREQREKFLWGITGLLFFIALPKKDKNWKKFRNWGKSIYFSILFVFLLLIPKVGALDKINEFAISIGEKVVDIYPMDVELKVIGYFVMFLVIALGIALYKRKKKEVTFRNYKPIIYIGLIIVILGVLVAKPEVLTNIKGGLSGIGDKTDSFAVNENISKFAVNIGERIPISGQDAKTIGMFVIVLAVALGFIIYRKKWHKS